MTLPAERRPVLAVSPHLDDAVMAAGATLAAMADAGHKATVCTVFAGQPPPPFSEVAAVFHTNCGLGGNAVSARKAEDLRALAVIGAEAIHLPHLDAIYRRHDGRWLCEAPRSMFAPSLPAEPGLLVRIARNLARLVTQLRPAAMWTCAATGGHVDHKLTCLAAAQAAHETGCELVFWEALPYVLASRVPAGIRPIRTSPVTTEHLARKIVAIEQYASQTRVLWPHGEDWRAQFLSHAQHRATLGPPELLWHAGGAPDFGHFAAAHLEVTYER